MTRWDDCIVASSVLCLQAGIVVTRWDDRSVVAYVLYLQEGILVTRRGDSSVACCLVLAGRYLNDTVG